MNNILKSNGYYAEIHFSADDEVFFGKLLGINDLVNFVADSVKTLKKSFKEAVDDYPETCKAMGKAPDKTYKGSFNVRIPSALHRQAAAVAAVRNITLNDLVRNAIDVFVSDQETGR